MPALYLTVQDLEDLQEICVDVATDGSGDSDPARYREIRKAIMNSEVLRPPAPPFLVECRTLNQVRPAMQRHSDHWQPRRDHIWTGLNPLPVALAVCAAGQSAAELFTNVATLCEILDEGPRPG